MAKLSKSLTLRLLSSFVLIPIIIGLILWGGWAFTILATICIVFAFYEWINLTNHMKLAPLMHIVLVVVGFLYLGGSLYETATMHQRMDGAFWTIVFMLCIWASDSGAYLFGKTIGGPKMTPNISPNKTWAGYVGALLFPALVLMIAIYIQFNEILWGAFLVGAIVGICGQSGDLLISYMKRKANLKDTGKIIPGHGGILDRIDALLMALPVFIAYVIYLTT